jgi:voltage-gated potassium channel
MGQSLSVAIRHRLSAFFDDDAPQTPGTKTFNFLLSLLIVVNVGAVILESVNSLETRYADVFQAIEVVATSIFVVEYVLRAWTAVDRVSGEFRQPLWGRIKYLCTFFALIDLVSILPALIGLLVASDLRVLRLLRLLRTIKLTRHSKIFSLIWIVLRKEIHAIGAIILVLCLILALSGSVMYVVEGKAQPNVFTSIPAAMWWAVETVTTVGYGDMVPVTVVGRALGSIISVVGVITFATFSGLITVGLMEELKAARTPHLLPATHPATTEESAVVVLKTVARIEEELDRGEDETSETIKTFMR